MEATWIFPYITTLFPATIYSVQGSAIHNASTFTHIPQWLLGAIGGAVFTQLLTVMWDIVRRNIDRNRREKLITTSIIQDVTMNRETVANNQRMLKAELTIVDKNEQLVAPIEILFSSIPDLMKLGIPHSFMSEDGFTLIRDTSRIIAHVNETIRSRESWRIHNQNYNNFSRRLRMYDEFLLNLFLALDKNFESMIVLLLKKDKNTDKLIIEDNNSAVTLS